MSAFDNSLKLPKGKVSMTAISKTIRGWGVQLPSAKSFRRYGALRTQRTLSFTRKIRNDFDDLAREHAQSTWLLGSHGGKARMQTDIQGIGLATRLEVGRLSLRERQAGGPASLGLSPV